MADGRNIAIILLSALGLMLGVIAWVQNRTILNIPSPYETMTHAQAARDIIEKDIVELRAKGNDDLVAQAAVNKLVAAALADHTQHLNDIDSDMATFQSMLGIKHHRKK